MLGLALSTLVAQALTNNWFMVYRALGRLEVSFAEHLRRVLIPCLVIFVTALGLGFLLNALLVNQHLAVRVGMVSGCLGLLLAGSIWRLALNGTERNRMLRQIRFA
jgi:hypothetical protein